MLNAEGNAEFPLHFSIQHSAFSIASESTKRVFFGMRIVTATDRGDGEAEAFVEALRGQVRAANFKIRAARALGSRVGEEVCHQRRCQPLPPEPGVDSDGVDVQFVVDEPAGAERRDPILRQSDDIDARNVGLAQLAFEHLPGPRVGEGIGFERRNSVEIGVIRDPLDDEAG